jgi:hypothetical protein
MALVLSACAILLYSATEETNKQYVEKQELFRRMIIDSLYPSMQETVAV